MTTLALATLSGIAASGSCRELRPSIEDSTSAERVCQAKNTPVVSVFFLSIWPDQDEDSTSATTTACVDYCSQGTICRASQK